MTTNGAVDLRDQAWLEDQLAWLWEEYFGDISRLNPVTIGWGRTSRYCLGTIRLKRGGESSLTHISLNSTLREAWVPDVVIWQTIAHELTHYGHGFASPHPRRLTYPHRGGVIKRELSRRGLSKVYNQAQAWLKRQWPKKGPSH